MAVPIMGKWGNDSKLIVRDVKLKRSRSTAFVNVYDTAFSLSIVVSLLSAVLGSV